MKIKSIALLGLALVCGLVAAIGVTQVIAKPGADDGSGDQSVFVATVQILPGRKITPQMLKVEEWPANRIPEGTITNIEDIEGRYPRRTLDAGDPIREGKLLPLGVNPMGVSGMVPKGYRLFGVKVDQVSAGKLLQPGDRVDLVVFLAKNTSQGISQTSAWTFLRDIKVFAIDGDYKIDNDQEDEEGGSSSRRSGAGTVRLMVTPRQAEKIMLASELGKIRLVLRGNEPDDPTDENSASDKPVTLEQLIGQGHESGDNVAEKPVTPEPNFDELMAKIRRQAAQTQIVQPEILREPERFMVRIIQGDEVNDVVMVHEQLPGGGSRPRWVPEGYENDSIPMEEPLNELNETEPTPEERSLDSDMPGFMSPDAIDESTQEVPKTDDIFEAFKAMDEGNGEAE